MILTGKGGAFASPSSTDIIVVMDRSVSITGTLTN